MNESGIQRLRCKDCLHFIGKGYSGRCDAKPKRRRVDSTGVACNKMFMAKGSEYLQPSADSIWQIACSTCKHYTQMENNWCRSCQEGIKGGWESKC